MNNRFSVDSMALTKAFRHPMAQCSSVIAPYVVLNPWYTMEQILSNAASSFTSVLSVFSVALLILACVQPGARVRSPAPC